MKFKNFHRQNQMYNNLYDFLKGYPRSSSLYVKLTEITENNIYAIFKYISGKFTGSTGVYFNQNGNLWKQWWNSEGGKGVATPKIIGYTNDEYERLITRDIFNLDLTKLVLVYVKDEYIRPEDELDQLEYAD